MFKKNPLSKEELVARLKALAADGTPKVENFGAMCYSQMSPPQKKESCQMCGKEFTYSDWHDKDNICELVKKMKEKGYDVKVDIMCHDCAEKMIKQLHPDCLFSNPDQEDDDNTDCFTVVNDIWPTDINFLFSFRPSDAEQYHQVIANYPVLYRSLYSLMENKRRYSDDHDASHYIEDETDILQFMTGIIFDE